MSPRSVMSSTKARTMTYTGFLSFCVRTSIMRKVWVLAESLLITESSRTLMIGNERTEKTCVVMREWIRRSRARRLTRSKSHGWYPVRFPSSITRSTCKLGKMRPLVATTQFISSINVLEAGEPMLTRVAEWQAGRRWLACTTRD
jgi:hypothetical protein